MFGRVAKICAVDGTPTDFGSDDPYLQDENRFAFPSPERRRRERHEGRDYGKVVRVTPVPVKVTVAGQLSFGRKCNCLKQSATGWRLRRQLAQMAANCSLGCLLRLILTAYGGYMAPTLFLQSFIGVALCGCNCFAHYHTYRRKTWPVLTA